MGWFGGKTHYFRETSKWIDKKHGVFEETHGRMLLELQL